MDKSLPDHFDGCLVLQRVTCSNKRTERLTSSTRLPVTQITTCLSSTGPYTLMSRTMLCFGPLQPGMSLVFWKLSNSQYFHCLSSIPYFTWPLPPMPLTQYNQQLPAYAILPRLTHFTQATTSTSAEIIPHFWNRVEVLLVSVSVGTDSPCCFRTESCFVFSPWIEGN